MHRADALPHTKLKLASNSTVLKSKINEKVHQRDFRKQIVNINKVPEQI